MPRSSRVYLEHGVMSHNECELKIVLNAPKGNNVLNNVFSNSEKTEIRGNSTRQESRSSNVNCSNYAAL